MPTPITPPSAAALRPVAWDTAPARRRARESVEDSMRRQAAATPRSILDSVFPAEAVSRATETVRDPHSGRIYVVPSQIRSVAVDHQRDVVTVEMPSEFLVTLVRLYAEEGIGAPQELRRLRQENFELRAGIARRGDSMIVTDDAAHGLVMEAHRLEERESALAARENLLADDEVARLRREVARLRQEVDMAREVSAQRLVRLGVTERQRDRARTELTEARRAQRATPITPPVSAADSVLANARAQVAARRDAVYETYSQKDAKTRNSEPYRWMLGLLGEGS